MDYTDALIKAKQAADRFKAAGLSLDNLTALKQALEQKVTALKASVFEEEIDVDNIKEDKVHSLFLSLRGKLKERMEKEESEALVVKLLLDQTKKELAELTARIDALTQERAALSDCEAEYDRLYEQRRQALMLEGEDSSRFIKALSEDISRAKAVYEHTSSALETGRKLLEFLSNVIEHLDKTEESAYMRGAESLLFKDDCIEDAKKQADEAQKQYYEFKAQAAGTRLSQDALASSGFVALDVLIDDIIAARFSADRIGRSKIRAEAVKSEVFCDVLKLKEINADEQSKFEDLKAQLDALMFRSGE